MSCSCKLPNVGLRPDNSLQILYVFSYAQNMPALNMTFLGGWKRLEFLMKKGTFKDFQHFLMLKLFLTLIYTSVTNKNEIKFLVSTVEQ